MPASETDLLLPAMPRALLTQTPFLSKQDHVSPTQSGKWAIPLTNSPFEHLSMDFTDCS